MDNRVELAAHGPSSPVLSHPSHNVRRVPPTVTAEQPAYLSSAEARALLYVSRSQLSRYCLDGTLEATKTPGGSWRIKRDQPAIREALGRLQ